MFGNLLETAMSVIPDQDINDVMYVKFIGRITNAAGLDVTQYAPAVAVPQSSVQPIPRTNYEFYGLEQSKDYVTWYVPLDVIGLNRDYSGDCFMWNNSKWQCQNPTDWFAQDGWLAMIAVRVGHA